MILIKGVRFRKIDGMALWPFILAKSKQPSDRLIRHERIHLYQQIEMLIIPFYVWYILEWTLRIIQYKDRNKAYFNISFEREAYQNEHNPDYLKSRKFWNFIHYI
jgi:hypothetical protein